MLRLCLLSFCTLFACTGLPVESLPPSTECGTGAEPAAEYRLYFGRSTGGAETVTDDAWQSFLTDEITPRFPTGLTVLDATGQWLSGRGQILRERSKLVILLAPDTPESLQSTDEIARAYNDAFAQESVLRTKSTTCMSFISAGQAYSGE